MKKTLMFEMTVEVAQEFYRRCIDRNAQTREEKTEILIELAKEGQMRSVMQTDRTPDQVAKDMSKNFGNVLYVKPKKEGKDGLASD